jgi:hypothetical protein
LDVDGSAIGIRRPRTRERHVCESPVSKIKCTGINTADTLFDVNGTATVYVGRSYSTEDFEVKVRLIVAPRLSYSADLLA